MTWVIGGITLPRDPSKITTKAVADVKAAGWPGKLPLLVSKGNKARILSLEGVIQEEGKDLTYLKTTYLTPFLNKLHTEVVVAGPDTHDLR